MIGMKIGESCDINLTLPNNFEPAVLRGVDVMCTVGVTELFEYDLPEVIFLACVLRATLSCNAFLKHASVSCLARHACWCH